MEIKTRNVNTGFRELVHIFHHGTNGAYVNRQLRCGDLYQTPPPVAIVSKPSRNGNVLMIDEPVTITYSHPRERVLFNAARDANCFFHGYEALWMLAGRNDVAPVAYYAKQMKEYSDDGKTLNGAYGYRWRRYLQHYVADNNHVDQLNIIVNHLKADPNSRRAVLQMWNIEDDLLKIGKVPADYARKIGFDARPADWLPNDSKDICCNLSVMFSLRDITDVVPPSGGMTKGEIDKLSDYVFGPREPRRHYALDMTVTNRSNDMIWGALGANFCHFTILQEYMAARLGAEVGRYHHFTNNLHVYEWNWKPEEWMEGQQAADGYSLHTQAEGCGPVKTFPLIKDPEAFEKQLPLIVDFYDGSERDGALDASVITEPFLWDVARPMFSAFAKYKRGKLEEALRIAHEIAADDWRMAATGWISRRIQSREAKQQANLSQE